MKLFITGTPGTGKSTLSIALQNSYSSLEVFEIKELLIKFNLLEEFEPERDTTLFNANLAIEKIQDFLLSKYNFVLVGPPLDFPDLQFDFVIVLTCSKKSILQKRLEQRGYKKSKIDENLEAELLGEILGESFDFFSGKSTILELDSCKLSVDALVKKIEKEISP